MKPTLFLNIKVSATLFIACLISCYHVKAQYDIGASRNVNSSSEGLNIFHDSYSNIQLTTRDWGGSHGILFNAYKSASQIAGGLEALGNTKFTKDVGAFSSGAGAIMYYGNGGTMDFLISQNSTGINQNVDWGYPKMRIMRNGNIGIGLLGSPTAKLHLSGGDLLLQNESGSGYPVLWLKNVGGSNTLRLDYNSIIGDGGNMVFRSGASNSILLNDNGGNVGIGTDNPDSKLHIEGTPWSGIKIKDVTTTGGRGVENKYLDGNNDGWTMHYAGHYSGQPLRFAPFSQGIQGAVSFTLLDNGNVGIGTDNAEDALQIGDYTSAESLTIATNQNGIGTINFKDNNNTEGGGIRVTGVYGGSKMEFFNRWDNDETKVTFDLLNGQVGIGTTYIPSEYRLAVEGTIGAREIKVEASAWPDYVFSKNYKLSTLEATETFIQNEGHLPNIPSAAEVAENGISLGEMNAKLLEKIEELTLHMIEMKKEIEILKSK